MNFSISRLSLKALHTFINFSLSEMSLKALHAFINFGQNKLPLGALRTFILHNPPKGDTREVVRPWEARYLGGGACPEQKGFGDPLFTAVS